MKLKLNYKRTFLVDLLSCHMYVLQMYDFVIPLILTNNFK